MWIIILLFKLKLVTVIVRQSPLKPPINGSHKNPIYYIFFLKEMNTVAGFLPIYSDGLGLPQRPPLYPIAAFLAAVMRIVTEITVTVF